MGFRHILTCAQCCIGYYSCQWSWLPVQCISAECVNLAVCGGREFIQCGCPLEGLIVESLSCETPLLIVHGSLCAGDVLGSIQPTSATNLALVTVV